MNSTQLIAHYANHLNLHDVAAVFKGTSTLVIVYPTLEMTGWSFLQRDTPFPSGCQLAIQVRSNLPVHFKDIAPPTKDALSTLEDYLDANDSVLKEAFFEWIGKKDETLNKNVFLVFGEQRQAELEVTTRYFRGMGARVWTTGVKGSWDSFREQLSGVVVVSSQLLCLKRGTY